MPLLLREASCSREGGTGSHGRARVRASISDGPLNQLVQPMPRVHGQGDLCWSTSSITGGVGVLHPT